jgi:hypothetical protein
MFERSADNGRMRAHRLILAAAVLWSMGALGPAVAADSPFHRSADGLSVYLGVLPAAMVEPRHPAAHPEAEMHGGAPSGRHAYHVMVSVFDESTGERVEEIEVEAAVTPLGRATITRPLEPMTMAETVTFGNYFNLATSGLHQIRVTLSGQQAPQPTIVEFSYDHRAQ